MTLLKKMFIILITLTIVLFAGVSIYSFGRTHMNGEEENGNTIGNIYNGGLFVERDNQIYFSNDSDGGKLYVMSAFATGATKLYDDKVRYINTDGNYIYYVRVNQTNKNKDEALFPYNNNGIYRIGQNGLNMKLISNAPGAYLFLSGNHLYFQHYNVKDGLHFYRNKIDGNEERLLLKDAVLPATVLNNQIYFTGSSTNPSLQYIDLSSYTDHVAIEGNIIYPIYKDGYIYYIDGDNKNKLYRMNEDGSNPTQLVNKAVSTYNISNDSKYLFYQISTTKNNSINRLDLTTMKSEQIRKGKHTQIHVTTHNIFFKDAKSDITYIIPSVGKIFVREFNPMNLVTDEKKTNKNKSNK